MNKDITLENDNIRSDSDEVISFDFPQPSFTVVKEVKITGEPDSSYTTNTLNVIQGIGPAIDNSASITLNSARIARPPINKNTNKVTLNVLAPPVISITLTKKVKLVGQPDTDYADNIAVVLGDTVTFKVTITNNSTAETITSGLFNDTIPSNLSLIGSSLVVGETPTPVVEPNIKNVSIGSLAPLKSIDITYSAMVVGNDICSVNNAVASYNTTSGEVGDEDYVVVKLKALTIKKIAWPKIATLGTIINYTVILTNISSVDVNISDFIDDLDSDLTLVNESIKVDGVPQPKLTSPGDVILSPLPGSVPPVTHVITYSAEVTGYGSTIINTATACYTVGTSTVKNTATSNTIDIPVDNPGITIAKSVNLYEAMVTDILCYTITVSNIGNVPLTNLVLCDCLDNRLTIVPGSIKINDVPQGACKCDIENLVLPNLSAPVAPTISTNVVIAFQVTIKNACCQDNNRSFIVNNYATIYYEAGCCLKGTLRSCSTKTVINIPNPCVTAVKSVSQNCARINNRLTYTITINNVGNVEAIGLVLSDIVPKNLNVIPSTIAINGVPVQGATLSTLRNLQLPNLPVPLRGVINPILVTFDAIVNEVLVGEDNGRRVIRNIAKISYNYVGGTSAMTTVTNSTNTVITNSSSEYSVNVPVRLSTCIPIASVTSVAPRVTSFIPVNFKNKIFIKVCYILYIIYVNKNGATSTATKYYEIDIPAPDYIPTSTVTIVAIGSPVICKDNIVNIRLCFEVID